MTFNASIPNAGQSPGLFPSQSNTNFTRIKTIVNNDHIWSDSSAANEGTHRQVTLTNPVTNPAVLPATTNSIVFSQNDTTSGVTQLYFYNGTTTQQISGYEYILPMRVVGSASLSGGAATDVLNVSYNFSGIGHTWFGSGSGFRWRIQQFLRSGSDVDISTIDRDGGSTDPELIFTSTALRAKNNAPGTQTIFWSCVINRNS